MTNDYYRVTINGFWCRSETWDDMFNWDGKHDEVFIAVNTKVVDSNGTVRANFDQESEVLGDTWRLPNRVQVGSASDRGGIVSGDRFPLTKPWKRAGGLNEDRIPPYPVWEGELAPGADMVLLTPTIWEWDPGQGAWDGWVEWLVNVDDTYGKRAKEIFGGIWPVSKPVFDAVSLGIQTVGTIPGLWGPGGYSRRRPIGIQPDPANPSPDAYIFNPVTIALNSDTANYLSTSNLQGYGTGIYELRYSDPADLRGEYSIFVQVEKLSDAGVGTGFLQSEWRWCNKCQGLFYGPQVANSSCPRGGTHTPAEESGSGNYSVPHGQVRAELQSEWRWCNKCQGLFYGPQVGNSNCPRGGTHAPPSQSGSGNYSLPHNHAARDDLQSEWRWCPKCHGLFYGPQVTNSACPEGGTHTPPDVSRSGRYSLPHQPA